jgi:hypothetical protein
MLRVSLPTSGTTGNTSSSCPPARYNGGRRSWDVGDDEVEQPLAGGEPGYRAPGDGEPEDPGAHRLRMGLHLPLNGLRRDQVQHPNGVGLADWQRHDHHSVQVAPCLTRLLLVEGYRDHHT